MDDLRQELRAYFDAIAVQVEEPASADQDRIGLPESRRGKLSLAIAAPWRRRPVRSAFVAFALVVVGASAIALTVRVLSQSDGADTSSSPVPSSAAPECNGGNTVPCDPGDHNLQLTEKAVVGEGDHEGRHWQLLAYESEAGLCVDLRLGQGSGGACGFDLTKPVGIGTTSSAGYGSWLSGPVRKDVARIVVELNDGQPLEVTPVGADAGFQVNFFAVPLPAGATVAQVVSFNTAGLEIGRQQIPPHPAAPPPTAAPPTPCTATYRLDGNAVRLTISNVQGEGGVTATALLPDGNSSAITAELVPGANEVNLDLGVPTTPTEVRVELSTDPPRTCTAEHRP